MTIERTRDRNASDERAPARVQPYDGEKSDWDAFVRGTSGSTFFHLIGWKEVLERTFSLRSHYLVARRGEAVVGVLPLFELRSPFMERCLLSVPFAVEGGVASDAPPTRQALDAAAVDLGIRLGAASLELRDGQVAHSFSVREGLYYRFRGPLLGTDEDIMAALPSKRRNMIRRGQRNGLAARSDPADLDAFHDLYARTARRFGTPAFPARFFRTVLERFPTESALLVVRLGDVPVAGALMIFYGGSVCPYYVGSHERYFRYAVNDFLYWEVMRYGCRQGSSIFDFGRSKKGTGAYEFKRLWGFTPEPIRYRVHNYGHAPRRARSTTDPGLRRLQAAWRRLPLPLTKLLGPLVVGRYGAYYT